MARMTKLPMRLLLVIEETKQRLSAEISDLQGQLDEIESFLAKHEGTSPENVPHGAQKPYTNGHSKKRPAVVDKSFSPDLYTQAGISLSDVFTSDELADATGLDRKDRYSLIMSWTKRKWIVGTGKGKYQKKDTFGGTTDYRKRKQTDPRTLRDPDPIKDVPRPLEFTPEQTAGVAAANIDAARAALEKRLQSKQRQLDDCVPESPSEQILQGEVEDLEEQLAALEPR